MFVRDEAPNTDEVAQMEVKMRKYKKDEVRLPTLKGTIQQRQPDGSLVRLTFKGKVEEMVGSIEKVAEIVLEAEMHGNDGKSRIHLFLE